MGIADAQRNRKKAEADIAHCTGSSGIRKETFLSTANNVTAADSWCLIIDLLSLLHSSGLILLSGGVVEFGLGVKLPPGSVYSNATLDMSTLRR